MSTPNEQVELDDGRVIWNSRSIAILGIVLVHETSTGLLYVVAGKRGKKCPDYVGYWNMPCGYLDWDETSKEAASRELFEETGLEISSDNWKLIGIEDSPSGKQNVTLRYFFKMYKSDISSIILTNKNSEEGEVEELKLIPLKEYEEYKWAFNHDEIINSLIKNEGNIFR